MHYSMKILFLLHEHKMCSIELFEYLCDSYAVQIRHQLSWTLNLFKNERINSQYIDSVKLCVFLFIV